jgi:hypothetical protein
MFVTAHVIGVAPDFDLVLGGDLPQDGRCVAFDDADSVLGGGQVGGTVSLLGEGADGGNTFTVTGGKTVLIARYDLMGTPSGWLQFGSNTMGDDATIGGLVPYTGDAGATVAFAGGFQGTAAFPGGQSITNPDSISAVYVANVDGALSTVLWLERYGDGMANQVADAIAVDPSDGSILVAGHFQGTLDFGIPDGGLVNMSGTDQLFVAKLAP